MSGLHFHFTPVTSFLRFLGRTQPPNITDAYQAYFKDTPSAYIAYTCLCFYFLYRFVEASNHKQLNAEQEMGAQPKTNSQEIDNLEEARGLDEKERSNNRKFDSIVMGASALATVASINWSFAPFYPTPHLYTIIICAATEAAIYFGPSHAEARSKYPYENFGHAVAKLCRFVYKIPLVYDFLQVTNLESSMPFNSATQR